jgi:hypothetical protein
VHYVLEATPDSSLLTASDLRYVLSGDPSESVFSIQATLRTAPSGDASTVMVQAGGTRAADRSRVLAALGHVFIPVCRSTQVAQWQGRGRLDAFHGEG